MADVIKSLLEGNKKWVEAIKGGSPGFFDELSKGQSPEVLWIGCSDSRVPVNQVTGSDPGTIFVQRNIANMVVLTDNNLLSVVYYAVKHLKVKHIVVCGHYGCGGVQAAMSNQSFGFLDSWLSGLKGVYAKHERELDGISDDLSRFDRFVELNVVEQVENLSRVFFIQEEWAKGEVPQIHGLVFDLKTGQLKDLGVSRSSGQGLTGIFKFNW